MERNDITAAPAVTISQGLYEEWHAAHHGTRADFVRFLMWPSVERDTFLRKHTGATKQIGSVSVETY